MSNLTQSIVTEEQLKDMSVSELVALRKDLQGQLQMILATNPGVLQRLITKLNEALFEKNYSTGTMFPNEVYLEG